MSAVFETIIEEQEGSIKFNPNVPCLQIKWKGEVSSDCYRRLMDRLIIEMAERKIGVIVNDDRKTKRISKADQKWALEDWLPRAVKAGYYAIAILQTPDFFKRVSAQAIAAIAESYFENQIRVRYFQTMPMAEKWLKVAVENYESRLKISQEQNNDLEDEEQN
ncbi:MAG: hypothetical protein JJT94_11430 [Bernardetiaceae bacterium]|nr:hypothetical protein [Bernardetiaceae bacterium]